MATLAFSSTAFSVARPGSVRFLSDVYIGVDENVAAKELQRHQNGDDLGGERATSSSNIDEHLGCRRGETKSSCHTRRKSLCSPQRRGTLASFVVKIGVKLGYTEDQKVVKRWCLF